jgi:peptide-methionine (S)-S-oxide reductase
LAETATPINPPLAGVQESSGGTERAVFAGGCFWGVQAVFQHTKGVTSAVSGYAGGAMPGPSYEKVSSGRTGHAESVEITFDPNQISYGLLQIYFSVAHDPTQLNRQGPDEGTSVSIRDFCHQRCPKTRRRGLYRSTRQGACLSSPDRDQGGISAGILSGRTISSGYATLHPSSTYIAVYDLPKIATLKKLYPELYREQAVLIGDNKQ